MAETLLYRVQHDFGLMGRQVFPTILVPQNALLDAWCPEKGKIVETADIIVAPFASIGVKTSFLNEVLEKLLTAEGLFTDKANRTHRFTERFGGLFSPYNLDLGFHSLVETVGTETQKIATTYDVSDPSILERREDKGHIEEELKRPLLRTIKVRLYPTPDLAEAVYRYETGFLDGSIDFDQTLDGLRKTITGDQLKMIDRGQNPAPDIDKLIAEHVRSRDPILRAETQLQRNF